jgi:predicted metalloprotease with PDZ domain
MAPTPHSPASTVSQAEGLAPQSLATTRRRLLTALAGACALPFAWSFPGAPALSESPYPGVMGLWVDATDLDRRVFRVRQKLAVRPGPLTLLYPKYLPGTHGPSGPVERLAGLQLRCAGQSLPWRRDPLDGHVFHTEIPALANELELSFEFLTALQASSGRVVMTREMLNLQWINTVLYPAGYAASRITVQAELKLPEGWTQACALREASRSEGWLRFHPVDLDTLADSPVFAGLYHRAHALEPSGSSRPVTLHLFGDEPSDIEASAAQIEAHRNLVLQSDRLFASRHFRHYDFLLAISDRLGGIGLEHHQSSENAVRTGYFKDWDKRAGSRSLLPHEYAHSWNGKFRRPADLLTPHFNTPMQGSLLWLYEGQTDYWGRVLAVRCGLVSPAQARDSLAEVAASYAHRAGKLWRNLQDTTNEPAMGLRRREQDWPDQQRASDYYSESSLMWLDADSLIREASEGRRSLDDFARLFFGVQDGRIEPLAYTFEDIVSTLNQVQALDWARFLRERLDGNALQAFTGGLERCGWTLSWAPTPSEVNRPSDPEAQQDDFLYSLGLSLRRDGKVERVMWASPAFDAGMSRALTVVAVNRTAYKGQRLSKAIAANTEGKQAIELLVREGDAFRTLSLDYRGGLRYPRLTRLDKRPERLDSGVFAPR